MLLFVSFTTLLGCSKSNKESYISSVNENDIAKLSLFAYDGKGESSWGLMNLGHAFITIENISDENIFIIRYTIHPIF
jgi:hypothetical protein